MALTPKTKDAFKKEHGVSLDDVANWDSETTQTFFQDDALRRKAWSSYDCGGNTVSHIAAKRGFNQAIYGGGIVGFVRRILDRPKYAKS